jgi:hypothetical protein
VKFLAISLLICCVAACDLSTYDVIVGPNGNRVHFTGGDGSSLNTAIVIHASKQDNGVPSESVYIWARYPGSRETRQDITHHEGKVYSVRTFLDADAKEHVLYFDESEYYGKL